MLRRRRAEFEITPASYAAIGLGAVTGLRSMAGPALLARAIRRGRLKGLRRTRFAILASPRVRTTLQFLMAGEMAADKTPFVPSRTSPPALLGRALSGALVGAALFADERREPNHGALLGALSAVAAAYAGEKLREKGTEELGAPDPILALLEDRIVLSLGPRLLRKKKT